MRHFIAKRTDIIIVFGGLFLIVLGGVFHYLGLDRQDKFMYHNIAITAGINSLEVALTGLVLLVCGGYLFFKNKRTTL